MRSCGCWAMRICARGWLATLPHDVNRSTTATAVTSGSGLSGPVVGPVVVINASQDSSLFSTKGTAVLRVQDPARAGSMGPVGFQ